MYQNFTQISSRDSIQDQKVEVNKYLTVTQEPEGYVWKVDGDVRTITADPPSAVDGAALDLGVRYKIENKNNKSRMMDCVGESIM